MGGYRDVLTRPGALMFSGAGLVARLPISMVGLGIVLLVENRTGSYGVAGTVTAAYMLTSAGTAPLLARLIDSRGQRRVLIPGLSVFALALGVLVLAVERSWPLPLPHLVAAVAGASFPPIGSCVRARWTHLLGQGPDLHTAFSVEAVVDEVVFMVGPVLVTVLATQVHPMAGVASVATFAIIGGWWFTSLRATEPPPRRHGLDQSQLPPMNVRWLGRMVLMALFLGSLFGAIEVITVAFAEERNQPGATGVLLAVYALGSLIAGVVTGLLSGTPEATLRRFRWGATAMAVSMLPLPFIDDLAVLGIVLFVGGFAISPTLVSTISLVEANVPTSRLTEGMTWVLTGFGLGIAPGAAVAGVIIDEAGASPAFIVCVVSGVLAALLAWNSGASVARRAVLV